jgi:hypothetical protein
MRETSLNLILQFDRRKRQKVSPQDKYTVLIRPTEIVEELLSEKGKTKQYFTCCNPEEGTIKSTPYIITSRLASSQ